MRLRRDGLAWNTLDDEVVLLDLVTSTYFTARGTGATLLHLLEEDTEPRALVDALATAHPDVARQTLSDDVDSFVTDLRNRGLLDEGP